MGLDFRRTRQPPTDGWAMRRAGPVLGTLELPGVRCLPSRDHRSPGKCLGSTNFYPKEYSREAEGKSKGLGILEDPSKGCHTHTHTHTHTLPACTLSHGRPEKGSWVETTCNSAI